MPAPPVPYRCQWESPELVPEFLAGRLRAADDPRWAASGAANPGEYEFWSRRSCGMACLRMILAYRGLAVPAVVPLAQQCTQAGGYVVHPDRVDGLFYRPFADWIKSQFGISATVWPDLPPAAITKSIEGGGLAIISVHPSIRSIRSQPPVRGGHLVLVTSAGDEGITFHNPSGLPGQSQENASIGWPALSRFYAGRGITIQPG